MANGSHIWPLVAIGGHWCCRCLAVARAAPPPQAPPASAQTSGAGCKRPPLPTLALNLVSLFLLCSSRRSSTGGIKEGKQREDLNTKTPQRKAKKSIFLLLLYFEGLKNFKKCTKRSQEIRRGQLDKGHKNRPRSCFWGK